MASIIDALVHPDALELAQLLRPSWPEIRARIPAWHPTCDGEEDDAGEADDDAAGGKKADGEEDDAGEADDDAAGGKKDDIDWKSQSRKHERSAKKERKAREDAERKLREREEEGQSESEKAVAKAREEAKAEALAESQADRRHDRLEVSVTRLATIGIKVKDGDEEKTVKFADPDDALVHIERAIKAGDVDEDDIYDSEGKVQTDALRAALGELLDRKPHLKATDAANGGRPAGSADGGKGGGAGKDQEDLSVEEHLDSIKRHKD